MSARMFDITERVRVAPAYIEPNVNGDLHKEFPNRFIDEPIPFRGPFIRGTGGRRALLSASVLVWYMFSSNIHQGWKVVDWNDFAKACVNYQTDFGSMQMNINQALYGMANLHRTGYVRIVHWRGRIYIIPTLKLAHLVRKSVEKDQFG
ncbi:MAG: hypothetical protein UU77_C0034G0003 [candidate division WWE3 bacterium GW2011_GWC1_41_7]|uniref:Uncharacterized protein n=3 Tax=Katanobacteria TaxID=422282 RepID=A0A0G0X6G8_UNCKA|nr:MAG: hypothetical protein UU72_C0026G0021 [candidate division WWE3 bacterium GW2011_GWB1_41_6]KKS19987.1 MAG: hypothetical protein UU77_C0034G0003 [candidate division WWE3 bacterium GW2011_GWC1_41_7]KKS21703.1 MAG: hypothetical protein UU80_C0022G0006 [candidate division WWE3 bacterium GW2011_GWA1_41_8]